MLLEEDLKIILNFIELPQFLKPIEEVNVRNEVKLVANKVVEELVELSVKKDFLISLNSPKIKDTNKKGNLYVNQGDFMIFLKNDYKKVANKL